MDCDKIPQGLLVEISPNRWGLGLGENGLEAQPDEGWTLSEAVVLTNLVGIGKGLVHDDDEGMAEEGGIIVAHVSHGFAHDSTSEI